MRWKAANLNFVGFYLFATTNIKSTTVTNSHATSTLGRWWRWHDGPVSRSVGCFRIWGISFFLFFFFIPNVTPTCSCFSCMCPTSWSSMCPRWQLGGSVSSDRSAPKHMQQPRQLSNYTSLQTESIIILYVTHWARWLVWLCLCFFFFLCPGQKWFKPLSVVLAGKQLTHTARVMVANRNCYISLLSWSQNIKRLNLNGEIDMCRSNPGLLRSDSNVHHSFLFMSQTFGKQWIYSLPVRE